MDHPPSQLIDGTWMPIPGTSVTSRNPARPSDVVWQGAPRVEHVDAAVASARAALPAWRRAGLEARTRVLRRFQAIAKARSEAIASLICDEVGKVLWDARAEADLLASKVDITLDAAPPHGPMLRVSPFELSLGPTRAGRCEYRPHGVMAVLGPFNFPAHLPNGHIVPALLMGNTIVFKPSDKAPGVGQALAECFDAALREEEREMGRPGAFAGVFNLVQGGADIAGALAGHEGIDGVLFTGSWPVGRRIMQANLDRPGRMLALEMGGNNAAVVLPDADLRQAVVECVRSAFISTGQRCTCTRRLIVHEGVAQRVIPAICKAASGLMVGDPRATHPVFMGPLVSLRAREDALAQVDRLAGLGGDVLVPMTPIQTPDGGAFVTPGVMRVGGFVAHDGDDAGPGQDVEVFAPFLRVCVVSSLDEAVAQANATRFGLAASIFTRDQHAVDRFLHDVRAGCVNINTGTAGASSKLPFGGLGLSGNHRPAGAFSLDYCAYPVGSMIERGSAAAMPAGMRFDDAWLAGPRAPRG